MRYPTLQYYLERVLLDDRQITHLICVRLRHLLFDSLGGVLGLIHKENNRKEAQNTPPKSHIAVILGGHRLDE